MQGKTKYSSYSFKTCKESYDILIYSVIVGYYFSTGIKPHIITNGMEDEEMLDILKTYQNNKMVTASFVKLDINGVTHVKQLESEIKKHKTALVAISPGNYLTSSLNDIKSIHALCHKHKVPLFSNYRYFFGFIPTVGDSFVCETDKESILSISHSLLNGYKLDRYSPLLKNEISKNTITSMLSFGKKTQARYPILKKYRNEIIDKLGAIHYQDFVLLKDKQIENKRKPTVIIFGDKNSYSPNIIALLFGTPTKKKKQQPKKEFKLLGINDKWLTHIQVYLLNAANKSDIIDIIRNNS